MTTLTYTRNGQEYSTEVESLPATAIQYLLQYGWAQSLQDCIAGREKKVREEFKTSELADDEIESAVKSDIHGTMLKRMDAIIAGTVATRTGGGERDTLMTVARDMIRKAWAAKYGKIGKDDKAKFDELVANLLATKRSVVQAEFDRRAEAVPDVEI